MFTRGHLPVARGAVDEENSTLNEKSITTPTKRPEDVKIPAQKKIFLWKDVCYDIKLKDGSDRRLLDHVDGWVKPGTLTALMVRLFIYHSFYLFVYLFYHREFQERVRWFLIALGLSF